MKKLLKLIIAAVIIVAGVAACFIAVMQLIRGAWLWLVVLIAAGAVLTAGVRLAMGDRPREILRDMLFVFVRTH